jgi:MFS transporter, DHA1 family, multidrug resistance protein
VADPRPTSFEVDATRQLRPEDVDPEKKIAQAAEPDTNEFEPRRSKEIEPAEHLSALPTMLSEVEDPLSPVLTPERSVSLTEQRQSTDRQLALEKTRSKPISMTRSADGTILVDWYTTDDPDNPKNWSQRKKMFVLIQIW